MRSKAPARSLSRPAPADRTLHRGGCGGLTTGGLTAAALGLQQTLGNRLTGRLLAGALVQPKLTINRPGDRYEQEADHVADEVMQRQSLTEDKEDEEELLQAKRNEAQVPTVTSSLAAAVESGREDAGQPLDAATRGFMEARFGHDFGNVRVHTGFRAAAAAQVVKARAFTVGSDVVFDTGCYAPGTTGGRRLLAHELAHTVQQAPHGAPRSVMRAPPSSEDVSPNKVDGRRLQQPRGRSTPTIQRSPWVVTRTQPDAASSDIAFGTISAALTAQDPPSRSQAPVIVKIGEEDMRITSKHPKLVQFATAVRGSPTPAYRIEVVCFWDAKSISESAFEEMSKEGRVRHSILVDRDSNNRYSLGALNRAQQAKLALSELGIPSKDILAYARNRNTLSDPQDSPSGLVRIAFGETLPTQPVPPPRITEPVPPPRVRSFPPPSGPHAPEKGKSELGEGKLADLKKAITKKMEEVWKGVGELPSSESHVLTGVVVVGAGVGVGAALGPQTKDLLKLAHGVTFKIELPNVPGVFEVTVLNYGEPTGDPRRQTKIPDQPDKPAGQGAVLTWTFRFR